MSFLLSEIKRVNRDAARVLEEAELRTDSEILTLTREDLHELFPGPQHFKLRRTLYDIIHKQPIAEQLLKKLKGFLPRESVMAALTNNGVLVEYLQILKDTKTQVNSIQSFLDAHIGLLEEFSADQPDSGQTDGCSQEAGGLGTSDAFGQNVKQIGPTGPQEPQSLGTSDAIGPNFKQIGPTGPQEPQSLGTSDAIGPNLKQSGPTGPQEPQKHHSDASVSAPAGQRDGFQYGATATLLYKMVVGGGETFGTDRTLMQKVEKPFQDRLRPCGTQDNKITFVFCPISSRVGADVEAAMVDIKDDKPIVLVLMHHTHEVKAVSSMKIRPDDDRIMLRVNVFYHETCGLLKCEPNDAAVTEIQNKLEESFIRRSREWWTYPGGGYCSKSADGKL